MSNNLPAKSFWKKPEGKVGACVLAGGVGALGYGSYIVLPILITLFTSAISATVLGTMLFLFIYTFFINKKSRTTIWYLYKNAIRKVTSLFINIDPVSILKSYLKDLRKKLGVMNDNIEKLKGHMNNLERTIKNNEVSAKKEYRLAKQARNESKTQVANVKYRKGHRLVESNKTLSDMLNKMTKMYGVLCKLYDSSKYMIEDLGHEIEVKERERKSIMATESAIKAARSIIDGSGSKREIFDETMESVVQDYDMAMGRITRFLETSDEILTSIDLENAIIDDKALQQFDKIESEVLLPSFGPQ